MAKNVYGGGSKTNKNGLKFEQETDFKEAILSIDGYEVRDKYDLYYNNEFIGKIIAKQELYKQLLVPNGINYREKISKKLLPDEAIYVYKEKTLYILEKKFQNGHGSVDEKLQTCDFKKKQYEKLVNELNLKVEYIYILNDWFKQEAYKDVRDYILEVGCKYYFNEIPLEVIGIRTK